MRSWRSAIVDSDLRPMTKLVALVASLHLCERGFGKFPSDETLASEASLKGASIRVALRELEDRGWLHFEIKRVSTMVPDDES